jgi:large subunit ribosomal protein L21
MYAVIQAGGKQYKVEKGSTIIVDKMTGFPGDDVVLDSVLMVGDGDKATVGRPMVAGASVVATVVRQGRAAKVIVFKKRSKKGYKKTQGHRQYVTELTIKEIKQ